MDTNVTPLGDARASQYRTGPAPWDRFKHLPETEERLLPLAAVRERVGLGKSTIYDQIRTAAFPAPMAINGRSLWPLSEIIAWQEWHKAGGAH